MHIAAQMQHPEAVELLRKSGADHFLRACDGSTLLHCAINRSTKAAFLQYLVDEFPAFVDLSDSRGRTALHLAIGQCDPEALMPEDFGLKSQKNMKVH